MTYLKRIKFITYSSFVLCGLTLLSGIILASSTISADDEVVTNVAVTVPVSCMMTGTEDTAHNANVTSSTYQDNIGLTTLKVICNENSGFSIYAIGYSNNEFGNNKLLATVGGELMPTYDIVTGTAKSGSTSNWAMKLNPVTTGSYVPTIENNYNDYNNVPSVYTKVATFASSTDTTIGASVQATYAAYINPEQPAGTYNGKVKFTMVHPASEVPLQPQTPTAGCINYFANASDAVGTMGCQSASDNASIELLASNFSRNGYGFAGWSDAFDYRTNENAHFYGPQETITVPAGTTANGLALYAVWVKSAGNLQDTNKVTELCGTGTNALTAAPTDGTADLDSVSALTDQRDNNTYAIAKLADGNCWMIENLRLEAEDTRSDANKALAQGYGTSTTYGNFFGLADAESTKFSNSTTANSLYYSGTQEGTASIDIGTSNNPAYRMPRYNNTNTSARASSPTSNGGAMYSYGNYYTWSAAMANTIYYRSPTVQDADGKTSETVNTSLCPTGWRLPYGRNTGNGSTAGGFSNLDIALDGTGAYQSTAEASLRWRKYPNNFLYSGYFSASSAFDRGSNGYYWSSSAYGSIDSYYLRLNSSSMNPGAGNLSKSFGSSIRCTVSAGS